MRRRVHPLLLTTSLMLVASVDAQDMPLTQVLLPNAGWELVSEGHQFTEAPAVDAEGNIFFADVPASKIYRINHATGKPELWVDGTERISGLMTGPDGRLYGCSMKSSSVVAYDKDKNRETIAVGVPGNDLAVSDRGHIYVTDPRGGQVWLVDANSGEKRVAAKQMRPNGVILWPKQGTLVVTDNEQPHLWTFRIDDETGSLHFPERYYGPLQMASGQSKPGSDGMTVDSAGRLYVASHAGLQMFDPIGRLGGAIAKPQPKFLSNVVFGGPQRDTLYVTCQDKVFRRKTKVRGVKRAE